MTPDADWRLPHSTSDLYADLVSAYRAHETATTPAQSAAVQLRIESLTERWTSQQVATDQVVTELIERLSAVFAQIGQAFQAIMDSVVPVVAGLRNLHAMLTEPPEDPRARALWLRQHRNTGPQRVQRAPRRLDARRGYR